MNPYAKTQDVALNSGMPQQAEAWALTTAARRMTDAKPVDVKTLLDAVRVNWRLWTIFQSNLASPDCGIPGEIRSNLLSLANFIDKRSVELLTDPDPNKVDVLININRQIAAGLLSGGTRQGTTPGAAAVSAA